MILELKDFLTNPLTIDVLTKLFIALCLSLIIGIEREVIHKPAGIKTHTLTCLSATLIMCLGEYLYHSFGTTVDPSRLPAQILTGIGFVGAGTIIRDGFSVKGITTAASLLAITCIGLAVGAGFYSAAIITTIFIFFILCFTNPLQQFVNKNRKIILFTITANSVPGIIGKLDSIFENNNIEVLNIRQVNDENSQYTLLKFLVKCSNQKIRENIIKELCASENVKEVFTSKKSVQHDAE